MSNVRMERQAMDRFARYWEQLFQVVPEPRRKGVEAMGEAVQKELNAQIEAADLEADAKGTVKSWQKVRIGSGGGYAAVSPGAALAVPRRGRPHTYLGAQVSQKQVTRWLEKGHGTPSTGSRRWSYVRTTKSWHRVAERQGEGYVKGRLFYSRTKSKAWEEARKAADKVLSTIADEVDY